MFVFTLLAIAAIFVGGKDVQAASAKYLYISSTTIPTPVTTYVTSQGETSGIYIKNNSSSRKFKVSYTVTITNSSYTSLNFTSNVYPYSGTAYSGTKTYTYTNQELSAGSSNYVEFDSVGKNGSGSASMKVTITANEEIIPCTHPEKEYVGGWSYIHKVRCKTCHTELAEENHVLTSCNGNGSTHTDKCTLCGDTWTYQNCVDRNASLAVKKTYRQYSTTSHVYDLTCKCGYVSRAYGYQAHRFVNNVCTVCKFRKQATPGAVKFRKVKAGKSKKWTSKRKAGWYYGYKYGYWGYHWYPARKFKYYKHPITVTWTRPANTSYYDIQIYDSGTLVLGRSRVTATSMKYTYTYGSKKKAKMQVRITPYYRTSFGTTKGPTSVKTVTVK